MNLFLTSAAVKTLDKIVPLLPKTPKESSVLFIPTAAEPYESKPWIEDDRNKLIELGFKVTDFDLVEKTVDQVKEALTNKDIVFVAGGNTFYLLGQARKSGFESVVKEVVRKGVIYIGSSAGSVIAGPDIKAVEIFDDPSEAQLSSTTAFKLVDFIVLPHYKKEKYEPYHEKVMKEYGNKFKLIPITDEQMIVVEDNSYKII